MFQKERKRLLVFGRGILRNLLNFIKWSAAAALVGTAVGLVGAAFYHGLQGVTAFRTEHPAVILGLPAAGLLIVFMYHLAKRDNDKGTNSVLSAVRSEEELSITMAPLIFSSTLLTHLFGGSAGREGAALQLGGSMGSWFGKLLGMNHSDRRMMILCGMSACFAALFGTPMAAAVFPLEVVSVGIMQYSALVPCALSALIASGIAQALGASKEAMSIASIPELTLSTGGRVLLLAVLCAALSVVFCMALHAASFAGKRWIPNPYLRIGAAGGLIVALAALLHTTDYLGAGMNIIEKCMEGEVRPEAFVLKILFTALTLGAGYKGGEIVPTFFVGATFGCAMGGLLGLSPSLCAAVGMTAVFCGVTNSPMTSLLIALEIFGMEPFGFFLIGIAVSYMLSGYHSLYGTQKIVYSKYKPEYQQEQQSRE